MGATKKGLNHSTKAIKMTNLQKVVAIQDDGSHWYVIPAEMQKEFRRLEELASNDNDDALNEFIEKFNKYRTGGDLNNIQLYAEI